MSTSGSEGAGQARGSAGARVRRGKCGSMASSSPRAPSRRFAARSGSGVTRARQRGSAKFCRRMRAVNAVRR